MSVEFVPEVSEMPDQPEGTPELPEWLVPPIGGYVADDLDRLPNLPPHTQLIDGGLVFVSPQKRFHAAVISMLEAAFWQAVPPSMWVVREMSIVLSDRQRPEPDLSIVHVDAVGEGDETSYPASAVILVVEVVSPDSMVRDRERKPQLYAQAGIKHFWRVENHEQKPVVYVYELDPATSTYIATGIYRDQLKVTAPYDIEIALGSIPGPRRS